jgi:hypothetical protein
MKTLRTPLWRRTILRTIFGFIIAPISPGLALACLIIAVEVVKLSHIPASDATVWREAISLVELSAMLGYPVATILGVPGYFLLRWRGWNGLPAYLAAGALQGLICVLVWSYFLLDGRYIIDWLSFTGWYLLPAGMICGMVAALCFWLIVRPDRNVKRAELATSS